MTTLPIPDFEKEIKPNDIQHWALELIQGNRIMTVDSYTSVHTTIKDRTRDYVAPIAKQLKAQKAPNEPAPNEKGLVIAPRTAIKKQLFEVAGQAKSRDFLRYLSKEQYAALTIVSWYVHLKIEQAARLHSYYKDYHKKIPVWCAEVMQHLGIRKTSVLSDLPYKNEEISA